MEKWLLCDFHIHTNMSDGSLSLREVVDLYGEAGFDVIAITDHIFDGKYLKRLKERGTKVPSITIENFRDYIKLLKEESKRAWKEYGMILIPGFEVTNNTDKYHIVVLDVEEYIDPFMSVEAITELVRERGGISIAAHPEKKESDREHLSKHLYENMESFKELFDVWEVANQFDLFNSVNLAGCRIVANSDFHHLHHFFSWRTLIKTYRDKEAVKEALRENENVAITFFSPRFNKEKEAEKAEELILL
ncbi:PHP domain-containing protein [Aquifex pyrophilus]